MDLDRVLNIVDYTVEIWDWKTMTYVADISNILTGGLNVTWKLNDVETINFDIDLIQFENRCKDMGVTPDQVLTPYVHDIRVRRNGEYIVGGQVVEANISISNNTNPTIQVRCTGFLNLFKDRYLTIPLGGYKTAEMAKNLINYSQIYPGPSGIVKNPTAQLGRAYWVPLSGCVLQNAAFPPTGIKGGVAARKPVYGQTGPVTLATQLFVPAGTHIQCSGYFNGQEGRTFYIYAREYANLQSGQQLIAAYNDIGGGSSDWKQKFFDFTTRWNNPWLMFEVDTTGSFYNTSVAELMVSIYGDNRRNFNVTIGTDTASSSESYTIDRDYSLQNVKDAIMELTNLSGDADSIDFSFTPDRKFNIYSRKGSNKLDIEACYPGNIDSLDITRSASNLINHQTLMGSGIGDEKIEYTGLSNTISTYGVREAVATSNNSSLYETLVQEVEGSLKDTDKPTNLPKITIRDGSINPSNTQVGDVIMVLVQNGSTYLETINGTYRIMEYQLQTDLENVESVSLVVEPY